MNSNHRSRSRRSASFGLGTVVAIVECLLCLMWLVGPAPEWVKLLVAAVNVVAFVMYMVDKQYAIKGTWRIPEKYLFAVTLFGGVMGADFARRLYRHKTQKPAFNACVFIALVVQVAALGAVAQLPVEQAQAEPIQAQPEAASAVHVRHPHKHKVHVASDEAPTDSE